MSKPKMFLMSGVSGSGKSTYARGFAEMNGFQLFDIDSFYKAINGNDNCRDNKFEVWMAFYRAIHTAGKNGKDVVIDTNAITYTDRCEFLSWFPEFDHYLIQIKNTLAECLQNNAKRERKVPEDALKEMFSYWEPIDKDTDGADTYRGNWLCGVSLLNWYNEKPSVYNYVINKVVFGEWPADVILPHLDDWSTLK